MDDDGLMHFRRALVRVGEDIAHEEAAYEDVRQQLQAHGERIQRLRAEYKGIESYLRRQEDELGQDAAGTPETPATQGDIADGWDIYRTEAVARVLIEAGKPLPPKAIADRLAEVGRWDSLKDVAAALSHLKKRHRAIDISRGRWSATPDALERSEHAIDQREEEDVSTNTD